MKCPNCDIEMNQCSVELTPGTSVTVDQCHECGGVWFDRNELYQFREIPDTILEIDREKLAKPVSVKEHLNCPVCHTPMFKYTDPIFKNMVVFMLCKNCGGIWMNSSEVMNYAEFRKHFNKNDAAQKLVSLYSDPVFIDNLRHSSDNMDLTDLPDLIIKTALVIIQLMFGII
ncbi:MAG: zf-TFIIB domain-containing protein [bacterium]